MRDNDDTFPVEQKFVGFIIGPGGATLKQIKAASERELLQRLLKITHGARGEHRTTWKEGLQEAPEVADNLVSF